MALEASDRETVRRFERGELRYSGSGVWFDAPDDTGERKLNVYPAPGEAGQAIDVEWVFRPVPLAEDTSEPSEYPAEFHPKLLHFCAAQYYRTAEDSPELAEVNQRLAEEAISALMRYDNMRSSGEAPWRVPISGSTA